MAKPGEAILGRPRSDGDTRYRPPEPRLSSIEGCEQRTLARGVAQQALPTLAAPRGPAGTEIGRCRL